MNTVPIGSAKHLTQAMVTVKGVILTAVRTKFKTSWRAVKDPNHRSRFRWFFLGWVIAIPAVLLGGGFALAGQHLVLAQGPWVIYARIPGGLHTHGFILLTLGLALVVGLSTPLFGYPEPFEWLKWTLRLIAFYYCWSAMLFAMAPVAHGTFSYVGTVFWSAFALMPVVLLVDPPPVLIPRSEIDLIRAAIEVGIPSAQAGALASHLYRGPNAHH